MDIMPSEGVAMFVATIRLANLRSFIKGGKLFKPPDFRVYFFLLQKFLTFVSGEDSVFFQLASSC